MAELGEELRGEIDELVAFEQRAPGTDAERRAAVHLAERLRDDGRKAELESCDTWPGWPLAQAAHAVIAVVGSVISVSAPVPGSALVLVAALLTFLDGTGIAVATRRLLGRRATQNVLSAEDGGKAGTLVLVAHYDAGSQGALFGRRLEERRAAIGRVLKRPIGRLEPFFWAELFVLVCCLLRLPGLEGRILTALQFVPTVGLIVAVPLLVDIALSPTSPGAKDNASGVALALELARRHGERLEHFDLWLLLTGSQEALSDGMRGFLRRHKQELDKQGTVFVNVDEVGAGSVRYTRREGAILAVRSHVQLVDICEDVAEDDEDAGAKPLVNRTQSDGGAVRARGYPAITITCRNVLDYVPDHHQASDTPGRVEVRAMERALGFCDELLERVDGQLGPEIERAGKAALSESG
ncbi:MAG TPA: M28 family peptidase [Thermoleophilaceae bacterium]